MPPPIPTNTSRVGPLLCTQNKRHARQVAFIFIPGILGAWIGGAIGIVSDTPKHIIHFDDLMDGFGCGLFGAWMGFCAGLFWPITVTAALWRQSIADEGENDMDTYMSWKSSTRKD